MNLTDEELSEVHSILYDRAYYGDDEIVYGDGPEATLLRSALAKVWAEVHRREKAAERAEAEAR